VRSGHSSGHSDDTRIENTMTTQLTAHATLVGDVADADRAPGLTLYAADTPNTHKVAIMLEELGVEYSVALINISADVQKEDWHLAINPNGRTPTLVDRSTSPAFPVFESGAILLYLARKFPEQGGAELLPTEPAALSEVEQWLMWQMSALGPMLGNCMYFKRIAAPMADDIAPLQFGIDRYEKESLRLLQVLEDRLSGREYLCGPGAGTYTLADIACFTYAQMHWWTGVSEQVTSEMPNLVAWLARLAARPAVQQGMLVPSGKRNWQLSEEGREMREAVEGNAAKNGRPHFGWRDIADVSGDANQRPTRALAPPKPKL
jgi:GST-like protein